MAMYVFPPWHKEIEKKKKKYKLTLGVLSNKIHNSLLWEKHEYREKWEAEEKKYDDELELGDWQNEGEGGDVLE